MALIDVNVALSFYFQKMPAGSVVVLHACAHNPTGVDPKVSCVTVDCWAPVFGTAILNELFLPPASAVEVIESVPSVYPCVCVSVCEHYHGWTIWPMTLIFCMGVDLDLS